MKKIYRDSLQILWIILLTYLGIRVGVSEAEKTYQGAKLPWEPLPLPAGHQASHFIRGTHCNLGIRTTQDELLILNTEYKAEDDWIEVSLEEFATSESFLGPCSSDGLIVDQVYVSPPPGKVIGRIDFEIFPHAEAYDLHRFIILEDGTVWRWGTSRGMGSGFGYLFLSVGNVLVYGGGGFVIGWGSIRAFGWVSKLITMYRLEPEGIERIQRSTATILKIVGLFAFAAGACALMWWVFFNL